MASRLPAVLGAVALAAGLAVLPAAPSAAAFPQTVTFTSTPPVGADWFTADNGPGGIGYVAEASASSGLPVTFSVDPASAGVCQVSDIFIPQPTAAPIHFLGPGTCTIHADQPGNGTYLPADRVTQSFVIEKVQPQLTVLRKTSAPVRKRTFRATLLVPTQTSSFTWHMLGAPNQLITFSVAGNPVCSGTTNIGGVATCTASLSQRDWLRFNFTASYAGDARYKPVSKKGPTFGDKNPDPSQGPF